MIRRISRILLIVLAWLLGLFVVAFLAGTVVLRASRPQLSGTVQLAALSQPVSVARDSLGVPDIAAASRLDAAGALGYLHAQDRFFQMDLQRRSAAGELSALLGSALLETDRDVRRHRFRTRAQAALALCPEFDLHLLDSYTAGVNAGLADLKTPPLEYLVLRQKPSRWHPEDTILTLYAMFLDLSLATAYTEETMAVVRDQMSPGMARLLLPQSNRWEAPLQSDPMPPIVIPDSTDLDVRKWKYAGKTYEEFRASELNKTEPAPHQETTGSNNWAVAGNLTAHGGAIVANDMHLGHGLPNIWYRARMSWPEGEGTRSVVGVTLPGTPALVAGSNGQVAWGFTNSYGDWCDLILLELDPENAERYRTPDGWRMIERIPEAIEVSGADADTLWVEETIWGPIWTTDTKERRLVLRWTAHDPEAANLRLLSMETVPDVDSAIALSGTVGIPAQNLICADSQGRISWSIIGRIPRRIGWDGRLPISWADGSCRWDGYLEATEQPRIIDPEEGRLWSANNRVAAGEDLQVIGDGGYSTGARARQIRDDLRALNRPDEHDLLGVQLDDRAIFHGEWREQALRVLALPGAAADPLRAEYLSIIRDQWSGRAEPSSVSYRLVRDFAFQCVSGVYDLLTTPCKLAAPDFQAYWLSYRFGVTWEVIEARPVHLLGPFYADWDDFVLKAIDRVIDNAVYEDRTLSDYSWSRRNVVRIEHPFVQFIPQLKRWLAAPEIAMPGDSFMPRVQGNRSGASERMVVSPGRENEAIFHMPGGQSGHPLSPFFLAGHEAWVEGRPTPLLPGTTKYVLEMTPE